MQSQEQTAVVFPSLPSSSTQDRAALLAWAAATGSPAGPGARAGVVRSHDGVGSAGARVGSAWVGSGSQIHGGDTVVPGDRAKAGVGVPVVVVDGVTTDAGAVLELSKACPSGDRDIATVGDVGGAQVHAFPNSARLGAKISFVISDIIGECGSADTCADNTSSGSNGGRATRRRTPGANGRKRGQNEWRRAGLREEQQADSSGGGNGSE